MSLSWWLLTAFGAVVLAAFALGKERLKNIAISMWGKFDSKEELVKFLLLALIFGVIIGTYWTLRPLKDSIFNALVGTKKYQPIAKMVSLVFNVPLVIFYGKLVDAFPRQKVFYVLTAIYALLAFGFSAAFLSPTIGIASAVQSPANILGWAWYVYVESFGSLIVALFWAITSDITSPDAAKRGFPIIALFGQLGNIVGPLFLNTKRLGFSTSAPLVGICGGLMLVIGLLLWFFMRVTPEDQLVGYHVEEVEPKKEEKKEKASFLEGLKLLVTQGYLLSIFLIISFYEIIVTILDYHFKVTATDILPTERLVSEYLSQYAYTTGIVSMLCVLFGINNIQRKLGMRASLVLLPILVLTAVFTIKLYPSSLVVGFWIMVFAKAVNYALNQPSLKQLYVPTSKDAKYKSQSWIEMFGGRSSKAIGSAVTKTRTVLFSSGDAYLSMVLLLSLGIFGAWIMVALYASRVFNKAIAENKVVC